MRYAVAYLRYLVVLSGVHHADGVSALYLTVEYSCIYYYALVAVVV